MLDPFVAGGVSAYRPNPSQITDLYRNLPGSVLSTLNADGSPAPGTVYVPGAPPLPGPYNAPPGTDVRQMWDVPVSAGAPEQYGSEAPPMDQATRAQLLAAILGGRVPVPPMSGFPQPGQGLGGLYTDELAQMARAADQTQAMRPSPSPPGIPGAPDPGAGYYATQAADPLLTGSAHDQNPAIGAMTPASPIYSGMPMAPLGQTFGNPSMGPPTSGLDLGNGAPPVAGGMPDLPIGTSDAAAGEMPPPDTGVSRGAPSPAPPMPGEEALPADTASDAGSEADDTGGPVTANGDKLITIQKGQSMWKLAEKYYGDGHLWTRIAMANKISVKNPNKIYTGRTLVIPGTGEGRPMPMPRPAA